MNKFLPRILVFSAFILAALYGMKYLVTGFEITPFYLFSVVYFTLLNSAIYIWIDMRLHQDAKKFMFAFYLSTIIRLFGSLIVLAVYLVAIHEVDIKAAVVYIILYFFYTAFEVVNLIPNLRPGNKKEH
jgi:hypothetical protein